MRFRAHCNKEFSLAASKTSSSARPASAPRARKSAADSASKPTTRAPKAVAGSAKPAARSKATATPKMIAKTTPSPSTSAPAKPARAASAKPARAASATPKPEAPARRSRAVASKIEKPAGAKAMTRPMVKRATRVKPGVGSLPQAPRSRAAKEKTALVPQRQTDEGVAIKAPARRTSRTIKAAEDVVEQLRELLLRKLDDLKAVGLVVADVRGKSSLYDYCMLVTGTSNRHLSAMANEVVVAAKKIDCQPLSVSGERDAEWILVDFGDIVLHLMLQRTRDYYALEKLWSVDADVTVDADPQD